MTLSIKTTICFVTGVVVLLAGVGNCALSADDITAEFNKANEIFRQANEAASDPASAKQLYSEAILHYQRVIDEGQIKNSRLYYNLGNAYLLKGDVGRAILNYKRAERLEPADPDIRKNLSFARSRRIDKVEVKTQKRVLQTLFFWHYDFSIQSRFLLTCISFGGLFVLLTLMVWLGRKSGLVFGSVVCLVLLVCVGGSVLIESLTGAGREYGVIVSESVVARHGDGNNYPARFKEPLHSGTEFELIRRHPGWIQIKLTDGSEGWIPDLSGEIL